MAVNEVPVASYPSVVALHTTAEDAALDDSDMTPYMRYICETVPPLPPTPSPSAEKTARRAVRRVSVTATSQQILYRSP